MTGIDQNVSVSVSASLTGDAEVSDVVQGKTFYNTDSDTKLTGTLAVGGKIRNIVIDNYNPAVISVRAIDSLTAETITSILDGTPFTLEITNISAGDIQALWGITNAESTITYFNSNIVAIPQGNLVTGAITQYQDCHIIAGVV